MKYSVVVEFNHVSHFHRILTLSLNFCLHFPMQQIALNNIFTLIVCIPIGDAMYCTNQLCPFQPRHDKPYKFTGIKPWILNYNCSSWGHLEWYIIFITSFNYSSINLTVLQKPLKILLYVSLGLESFSLFYDPLSAPRFDKLPSLLHEVIDPLDQHFSCKSSTACTQKFDKNRYCEKRWKLAQIELETRVKFRHEICIKI